MDRAQPLGEQGTQAGHQDRRQRPAGLDAGMQRLPWHVLHGHPRSVSERVGVEEAGDPARADYCPRDQSLLLEALSHSGVEPIRPYELDGHWVARGRVGEVKSTFPMPPDPSSLATT